MLTVSQVARNLNVSAAIVYGWVSTGLLSAYRLGAKGRRGAIRIAEADLTAFLESLRTQKKPEPVKLPARKVKLAHLTLPK